MMMFSSSSSFLRRAAAPLATFSRSVTRGQTPAARFKGPATMVTKISDLSSAQVATVLQVAHKMKANPKDYYDALPNETLLMLFEKPSLRTRVSLEVGMTELGGHAISFMTGDSPLGKKETYGDTGACLSRYVTAITARVTSREQINGLCATASVPVAGRHARSCRSRRRFRRHSRPPPLSPRPLSPLPPSISSWRHGTRPLPLHAHISGRTRSERTATRPDRPSRCHRTAPLRAPSDPRVAHPRSQVSHLHAPLPGWRARLLRLAFPLGRVPFQSAADRPRWPRIGRETRAWLCTAQACDRRKKSVVLARPCAGLCTVVEAGAYPIALYTLWRVYGVVVVMYQ